MIKRFRVSGQLALKLEELGVPVAAVLRRARLPRDLFASVRVLVTTDELFALWQAIGEVAGDPEIGLKLATETRMERFHPGGLAALSCADLGAAINHLARYKQLTCPEEIVQQNDGVEWTIHLRWLLAIEREPSTLMEYCFAWLLSLARHGTHSALNPVRIELVQPRKHTGRLQHYFGCPIITGAAHNAIVFRTGDQACPFVTRNAEVLEMLVPQLDRDLAELRDEDSLVELVRSAIQQRLAGRRPAVEDIAQNLHMSPRTMQRRLQESGSSFARVLEQARHEMARYYLGNSLLELNETAYLLGYEDFNSFARAFRAWEGVPPGRWREANGVCATPSSPALSPL